MDIEDTTDSMQTFVWGPCLWTYLHFWSKSFPKKPTQKKRLAMANTLLAIFSTLPCNLCVDNIGNNLVKVGFRKPHTPERLANSKFMKNRKAFTRFLFDLHNQVSEMLGKDTSQIDYDQAMDDLEIGRAASCCKKRKQEEGGCTEPKYKACKTMVYIVPRNLGGGSEETNLNMDLNL
jgi:hypothetical protein